MRREAKGSFVPALAGALALVTTVIGPSAIAQTKPALVGVNFAGPEFNGDRIPGKPFKDFVYPSKKDIDYFADRGMNTFRLPFRWERLQRNLGWPLDAGELKRIDDVVAGVTRDGGYVLLDPHNYGRYFDKLIGSPEVPDSAFAEFWRLLAEHYKDNPKVIFGLMNEPFGIPARTWRTSAEAALKSIRETGAKNLVFVPGTSWSGAHSWRGKSGNAEAFQDLKDPGNAMVFEVHQYLDSDYSGTDPKCQSETIGVETLTDFTKWLRETGNKGFLGEFSAGPDPVCLTALKGMLDHMRNNSDVWIGWTYWAAGAWWGKYPFSVHPSEDGEKPQLKVLVDAIQAR